MSNRSWLRGLRWLHQKDEDRNLVGATFHIITITLLCMSLVEISWFNIIGGVCAPNLTMYQFFTFGYGKEVSRSPSYDCVTPKVVNLMRIIILFSFMAIIFSLGGFFLDIIGPKNNVYRTIRRYAVASACTVLWIMIIISICYYVAAMIEASLTKLYPQIDTSVNYEYGFYLIAIAGVSSLCGTFCTLVMAHALPPNHSNIDQRCLINEWDDLETFSIPPPPPPYNMPPPPYVP